MASEVPSAKVPLPEVFSSIGTELRDLARRLDKVEAAMSKLVDATARASADTTQELVTDLQALDLIQQSLVSLGDFCDGMARAADESTLIDVAAAVRGVNLAELATRLSRQRRDAPENSSSGDIEFF